MRFPRFRFTLKHAIVATAVIACLLAARSFVYSHATIQIRDIRDDGGSHLDVSYFSDFDNGCAGGNFHIPRPLGRADFSELAGRQWTASYRPRNLFWLNANSDDVIKLEITGAIDEFVASR